MCNTSAAKIMNTADSKRSTKVDGLLEGNRGEEFHD